MTQFYDLIVNKFLAATGDYLGSLDWSYMITLIILIGLLNAVFPSMTFKLGKLKFSFARSWRVIIVAVLLALLFYWLGDHTGKAVIKGYFQSMLAAMVLHKLTTAPITKFLAERVPAVGNLKQALNTQKTKTP